MSHFKHFSTCYACLNTCKISQLPVSLSEICAQLNIKVIHNSDLPIHAQLKENQLGACIIYKQHKFLIIRDTETKNVQRFTAAHEIGHVILKHLPSAYITKKQELYAECFALCLLMPPCIINRMYHIPPTTLCNLCQCPFEMYLRYNFIYTYAPHNCIYAHKCLQNFKNFLAKYHI